MSLLDTGLRTSVKGREANPLVLVQIGYKKVKNQEAVGGAFFRLKGRQGYLDLLTINPELLHERFSTKLELLPLSRKA